MTGSLPERAYLLTYRTDRHRARDRHRVGYLLRAAALAELLLRGDVTDIGGTAVVAGTGGTAGDPVLDDTLAAIRGSSPQGWRHWVRADRSRAVSLVRSRLTRSGVLVTEPARALGVVPAHRTVIADTSQWVSARAAVDGALRATGPIADLDPSEAVLAALLGVTRFRHVVSHTDRRRHRDRIDALALQAAPAVRALDRIVTRHRMARIAIATGGSHT